MNRFFFRLSVAVFSALLAATPLQAAYQYTTLQAASSDGQPTTAAFGAALSVDGGTTTTTTASAGDTAVIMGQITPDTRHVGQKADIFALVNLEGTFYMRTPKGLQPWAGGLQNLVPLTSGTVLTKPLPVEVYRGPLTGVAGVAQVYLGYRVQGSAVLIYTTLPHSLPIAAKSAPVLNPIPLTTTTARSSFPTATKIITPAWDMVTVNGSYVNDDSVTGFNSNSISDDGSRVVFSSWSSHGFGLGTRNCSFDWIYVRDFSKKNLSIAAYDLAGKILCGYESSPGISGNGKYLFYSGSQKPYSWSTASMQAFFRNEIGTIGYMPVSIKGLEFSFEQNGSLRYGTVFKGQTSRYMADRDGNSVVFSMKYLTNISEVPSQYNATLFDHAILRQDKGAQTVGNQDYTLAHGMNFGLNPDLYFDVSNNGAIVVYNEYVNSVLSFRAWDMLSRKDLGRLFNDEMVKEPTVQPSVCGVSVDGRYVLVKQGFSVPLDPARATTAYTKFSYNGRFSRYDRLKKQFLFVGVSEEETPSIEATCDYFTNDTNPRQMSNDGNRVFWRSNGYFFVRDIAAEKTVKIKQPSTIYQWGISGDGRYIVFQTDKSPGGTVYQNKYGGSVSQIYRFGPIEASDFGSSFSLRSFEEKLVAK